MTRVLDSKKSTNISSSFDSTISILSHAIKLQLFWSLLNSNDVLPRVLIFNYLAYANNNYYYYYEIIFDIQFKCFDDLIL
jgi:hypothetical protein